MRRYNAQKKVHEELVNHIFRLNSAPVCCLADIPIAHLFYQAQRYGNMAIGFHRESAVRHGFNPVFYTLHETEVLRSVYQGFARLNGMDTELSYAQWEIESQVQDLKCEQHHEVDLSGGVFDIDSELHDVKDAINAAQGGLAQFLAFVKTFDQAEFSTIYCEREWRATREFAFGMDDVAMIVLPKTGDERQSYFNKFVSEEAAKLNCPRSIPIVPWEDLIEH